MTEDLRMTAFCPYLWVLRFFRTTFDRHEEEHRSRPKGSIKKLLWEILQNSQKKNIRMRVWHMTLIVAALSHSPATLSWNMTHIVAILSYFPATLSWNLRALVVVLSYFPVTLSWNTTHIVAALSGYLAILSCKLWYSSLFLWATFLLLCAETLDGLI